MEEDNNANPRVTRARARRLSTLDTDSRPSTPLLDATVERVVASPRNVRKTRLNSATMDLRTPTRSTRASLARGETPEPSTPSVSLSATKRATRTPAKSVRKQITLKEESEMEVEVVKGNEVTKDELAKIKIEMDVEETTVASRSSPLNSEDLMVTPNVTPTDSGRPVTRSMSKTPPVSSTMMSNIPQPQFDMNNSVEEKQTETPKQRNADSPVVMTEQSLSQKSDEGLKKNEATASCSSSASSNKSAKLQVKLKNVRETPNSKTPKPIVEAKSQSDKMLAIKKDILQELNAQPTKIPKLVVDKTIAEQTVQSKDTYVDDDVVMESPNSQTDDKAPMSIQEPQTVASTKEPIVEQNKKTEEMLKDKEEIFKSVESLAVDKTPMTLPEPKVVTVKDKDAVTIESVCSMETSESHAELESLNNKTDVMLDAKEISLKTAAETSIMSMVQAVKTNLNNNEEPVVASKEKLPSPVDVVAHESLETVKDKDVPMAQQVVDSPSSKSKNVVRIVKDERLPDLTPDLKSRILLFDKPVDIKKKVIFMNQFESEDAVKPVYPKTPSRVVMPPVHCLRLMADNMNNDTVKSETPRKMFMTKRNSSTPLAKPEMADEFSDAKSPPLKIDIIKSLSDLESKTTPEVQQDKKKTVRRLVKEEEERLDEEEEVEEEVEEEEENEDVQGICQYFDNEVEVVDDYQSGDSMDSAERREIKENEIPHDGESVGSQDTVEDRSEESENGSLSSFIVSDNDVDQDDTDSKGNADDDGDDDIQELCFSSEPESADSDVKSNKQRRRIIVHDTSEDDEEHMKAPKENMDKSKSTNENEAKKLNISMEKSLKKSPETTASEKAALNKTATASPNDDFEVEEVAASSDEDKEREIEKGNKLNNKSVYEVPDSSEESQESADEVAVEIKTTTITPTEQVSEESDKLSTRAEQSISKENLANPIEVEDNSTDDGVEEATVSVPDAVVESATCQSSAFHKKQKHEDEAALLAEISSCDLSHLRQMFNPLQKSRRQTLYVQGPEMSGTEPKPKMKRRSEQLNSDVHPSQSFIETLAKEKIQRLKRKHMSKSFCGTADDLDSSVVHGVPEKRAETVTVEPELPMPEPVELPSTSTAAVASEAVKKPVETASKDTSFYISYCDSILQAANNAALEQKKQRIASGKKPKRVVATANKTVSDAVEMTSNLDDVAANAPENETATKLKKKVKRLQATKQAVKHAMQLLVPNIAKEPQTLARKLSPQPPVTMNKKAKVVVNERPAKRNATKAVVPPVSPVRSSDEENQHAMKRIKTSAGYVVISKVQKERRVELIKTRSGIMKVEPTTPRQKYFKEVPQSSFSRSGLSELPVTSKITKRKATGAAVGEQSNATRANRSAATESALRFKRQIFGRPAK